MNYSDVMRESFDNCVDKIMDLIQGHLYQIDRLQARTKVVKA